jgi:rubrerythrin
MKLSSVEEILRFAIRKEADAAAYYQMMADRSNPGIKKLLEELAKEEEGHRKKLEHFDRKKIEKMTVEETKGLGISEWMEDVPFSSDMNYADLLRMAIKNEERSQQLYTSTAQRVTEPTLKKLLLVLAQEESTHKERLEKLYDKDVLEWF